MRGSDSSDIFTVTCKKAFDSVHNNGRWEVLIPYRNKVSVDVFLAEKKMGANGKYEVQKYTHFDIDDQTGLINYLSASLPFMMAFQVGQTYFISMTKSSTTQSCLGVTLSVSGSLSKGAQFNSDILKLGQCKEETQVYSYNYTDARGQYSFDMLFTSIVANKSFTPVSESALSSNQCYISDATKGALGDASNPKDYICTADILDGLYVVTTGIFLFGAIVWQDM